MSREAGAEPGVGGDGGSATEASKGSDEGGSRSNSLARAPSGMQPPLRRFGTLKRLEDDEEWAAVVGE